MEAMAARMASIGAARRALYKRNLRDVNAGGPGVPEVVVIAHECTPVRCLGCRVINIGCENHNKNTCRLLDSTLSSSFDLGFLPQTGATVCLPAVSFYRHR